MGSTDPSYRWKGGPSARARSAELAQRLDIGSDRARVMARTARQTFRRSLRSLLARDGGTKFEIDGEIDALLEVLR